ncbi:hypothetical protein WJX73_005069 [Symbiochloris irregularis]|uniref:AB hydrolase-1 domain-containing protein n=1 Tax=Symbiochloris irregularis TaxID=706552 RepID=A0AAW1PMV3_9CHLO
MRSKYHILPFLANGHVETIFAALTRVAPQVQYARTQLDMPDGGAVALDYEDLQADLPFNLDRDLPGDAPVLILLPGLTGGSHDSYVRHMVGAARRTGIRTICFNSRGTSTGPVLTPQFYSASYTGDLREVVQHIRGKYRDSVLLAAGWSLGANILVRYLGEEGEGTPIVAAVSMCNPFDLVKSDANFQKGFSRLYNSRLASSLSAIFRSHRHIFEQSQDPRPYDLQRAANSKTIREFDDAITRISFGWPSVAEYYAGSGSCHSIPSVRIPLLCLQAENDPIAPCQAIPFEALAENPNCTLVTTPAGGHLGWVAGRGAPFGAPWSDQVALEWLNSTLLELYRTGRLAKGQHEADPSRVADRREPPVRQGQPSGKCLTPK